MSSTLSIVDRLILFVLALAALFFGVWMVLVFFDVPLGNQLASAVDQQFYADAQSANWFTPMLVIVAALALIGGLWLLIANLRMHRFSDVEAIDASDETGDITLNVGDIAGAVAAQLEEIEGVNSVRHGVYFDRGRPTMAFTVQADATANIPAIRAHLEQAEIDVREAVETMDIDTVYRIHLAAVDNAMA